MKKFFNSVKTNPMVLVFIFVLVIFTAPAIFNPGESNKRAIVSAIGIDSAQEGYEVALLTFIPTPNQSYLETTSVICGKGDTIATAIYNAELTLGKKVGLSHVKVAVISEELLTNDISKDIDYLARIASLSENTILIATNLTAKEFLNSAETLEKDIGIQLQQLLQYNINNLYVKDTTLEAFFKGYYSQVKTALVGYLPLIDESSEDATCGAQDGTEKAAPPSSPSGSGGGGNESGNGQGQAAGMSTEPAKKISNNGQALLVKNGKKVALLDTRTLNGLNLINGKAIDYNITIDNVTGGQYRDAKLTFAVRGKHVFNCVEFSNSIPVYKAKVLLSLELVEATEGGKNIMMNTEVADMPQVVHDKLDNKLRKDFSQALKVLRENKCDVLGVTELFYSKERGNFEKFLQTLDDPEDFLRYVKFDIELRVEPD